MVKGLRDENAPTRPLSAYISWQNSCRPKVVKGMPDGYSFGELASKFSEMWKAMSDGKKAPFEKTAKAAQEKYAKQMTKYKLTDKYKAFQKLKEQHKVDVVKKNKFKKDENAPTRPQSAYLLFCADERNDLVSGGMTHKDAMKKLGAMWNALSSGKKKPYDDKAAALKAKYEKAVEKYHKTRNYKTYMAEKEVFDANKKAELKALKDKAKPSKSRSKSAKRSSSKKRSAKKKAKKRSRSRSRSRSKAKKRSKSRSKSKKRSKSRSKKKRSKSRSKKRSRSRSRSKSKKSKN